MLELPLQMKPVPVRFPKFCGLWPFAPLWGQNSEPWLRPWCWGRRRTLLGGVPISEDEWMPSPFSPPTCSFRASSSCSVPFLRVFLYLTAALGCLYSPQRDPVSYCSWWCQLPLPDCSAPAGGNHVSCPTGSRRPGTPDALSFKGELPHRKRVQLGD